MLVQEVQVGQPVRTRTLDESLAGTGITQDLTRDRRSGCEGTVQAAVENHRGDLWRVRHTDGGEAIYLAEELVFARTSMPAGFRSI